PGVVRPAAEVDGDAMRQRVACLGERARRRAPGALDELRGPRQAKPALLARAQRPLADPRDELGVLDRGQKLPRDGLALEHLVALRGHLGAQQRVLVAREAVAL